MLAFNKRLAHPCLYYSILAVAGLPAVAGCPAVAGIPVVVLEKCMTEAGRRIKSMVRAVAHTSTKMETCTIFGFVMYVIQHCFICRPSDFTMSEDARIEPKTVVALELAVRRSNYLARSHPPNFFGTHLRQKFVQTILFQNKNKNKNKNIYLSSFRHTLENTTTA
jgi:hypothetical protein